MEPCLSTFVFPFFLTYGRKRERGGGGRRGLATRSTHDAVRREGVVGGQDRIFVERRQALKKRIDRERERESERAREGDMCVKRSRMKEEDEIETPGAKERP